MSGWSPNPAPTTPTAAVYGTHLPREDGKWAKEAQGVFRAPGSHSTPAPSQFIWGGPGFPFSIPQLAPNSRTVEGGG